MEEPTAGLPANAVAYVRHREYAARQNMQEQHAITTGSPLERRPAIDSTSQESLLRLSWVYDLYRLGVIIGASDGRQFQHEVLEEIVRGLGATSGSLALIDEEKDTMFVAACAGLPPEIVGQPLNLGDGVLGWVAGNGEPLLLIGDIAHDERFKRSAVTRDYRLGSAIVWPLKWRGRVTGILSLNRDEFVPPFTPAHLEHGRALLNLVVIAIENTRLQSEQEKQIRGLKTLNAELVAMHERLEEARLQVMQSEQMAALGRLAAGVAHEINNPLAYVSSNVGTLKNYLDQLFDLLARYDAALKSTASNDPSLVEAAPQFVKQDLLGMIAEVQAGVTRVKHIVRQLRLFSHSGQGEWEYADLHEAIESAIKFAGPELKRAPNIGKTIVLERHYGTIPKVRCIVAQINQVFLNLIVNAVQAIGDEGKVTIATTHSDGWVEIAIGDTGVGIESENLERIFQPFFTSKPPGQGTGLGLSLSYSIVRKHHGRIEVKSKRGQGSTFTIYLPVEQS